MVLNKLLFKGLTNLYCATKSLDQLFDHASDILENKLDKVMSIFKRRDVNFYNGYLAARVIVNN